MLVFVRRVSLRVMLAVILSIGVACPSPFQEVEDFAKTLELLGYLRFLSGAQATTFYCNSTTDPGTAAGATAQAGTLLADRDKFFTYTSSATQAYTFELTVTSGDADLYVYTQRTTPGTASVDVFSLKPGTQQESLSVSVSSGSYRCARVLAVSDSGYSFRVF